MKGRELYQCRCDRRTALRFGAGTVALMACGGTTGCGEATLSEPFTVSFDDYPGLGDVGGVAKVPTTESGFEFPIFIVRTGEDDYVAYSSECTHFGCEVEFESFEAGYVCPCHGSTFDIEGSVTNGPAKQDLVRFDLEWDEAQITLSPAA